MRVPVKSLFIAAVLAFAAPFAAAQSEAEKYDAVASILALVEAVEPDRVAALRADAPDDAALALALLDALQQDRLLDPGVAQMMRTFVSTGETSIASIDGSSGTIVLDVSVMNLFLLDLVTGTEPLTSVFDRNLDSDVTGEFYYVRSGPEAFDLDLLLANDGYFERALAEITQQATGFSYQPSSDPTGEAGIVDPLPVGASPSLLQAAYETGTADEFQPGDTMPGVVALLAFANAIDPSLIAGLDLPEGATPFETAQALIAELSEGSLLDPGVAASVAALVESGDDPPPGLLEMG